jgi:hypothetical protein
VGFILPGKVFLSNLIVLILDGFVERKSLVRRHLNRQCGMQRRHGLVRGNRMYRWLGFFQTFPEKIAIKIAWMLPRKVALWAYIRVMAHASCGIHGMDNVDDLTFGEVCKRWEAGIRSKQDWFSGVFKDE